MASRLLVSLFIVSFRAVASVRHAQENDPDGDVVKTGDVRILRLEDLTARSSLKRPFTGMPPDRFRWQMPGPSDCVCSKLAKVSGQSFGDYRARRGVKHRCQCHFGCRFP
jgi:hypothetical protein